MSVHTPDDEIRSPDKMDSGKQEYDEYRQNIVYYPIQYDENCPVYYFEYIQKTSQNKKLHFHNGFEIGVCMEGDGIFLIANRVYRFTKNCVSFISSEQPHIAQSPNESPSRWRYLTIDWEKMFGNRDFEIRNNVIHSEKMAQLVLMIYDEAEKKESSYENVISHLLDALMCQMLRYENSDAASPVAKNGQDNVYAAIRYICNNYDKKFSIKELAAVNHYSVNYFRKVFKERTGMTPLDYVINVRLKMAAILLRSTDKSILSVAEECGFSTLSSFNRYFKSRYNMTPSQWRKKWK